MKNTFRSRLLASTLLIGSTIIATPALAQVVGPPGPAETATAPNADDTQRDTADVVVTGSRIARPDLEAPSPVTTINSEAINLTGTVTPETLLNELPQLIPGNTRVSNNQGGEDFSTIDLRGLGPQRTLILVNGERLPASSTTGVVDIGTIPTGLIDRIDVVTGGASAVYGSDAVAGVVNFVLKRNFQGADVSAQYGISEEGDGAEFNVQGLFGGNFANDKGNLAFFASYYTRQSVSQNDRDFSRQAGTVVYNPTTNTIRTIFNGSDFNAAAGDTLGFGAGGSGTNQFGVVSANANNPFNVTFANVDSDCNPATAGVTRTGNLSLTFTPGTNALRPLPSTTNACGVPQAPGSARYNFNPLNLLVTPYKRYLFSTIGHYDVTDDITFNVLANYTRSEQTVNLAPTPATGISVPFNSPLLPADLRAALATRPNPTAPFTYARRFTETGPRIGTFQSDAYNVRGTLDGSFNANFKWNVTASYGNVDVVNLLRNNINATAVVQGLNGCPTGSLPGCVALNIFGANTLTPAMLNFVRLDTKETRNFNQARVVANVTGSLFNLPGGPVGIAVGGEIRRDRGNILVDDAQRTGNIFGFNATQSQNGRVTTREVYGEVRAPLLANIPFVHELTIEGGARYSDYTSVGGLFNWKAGAEFAPVSWLRFRGIYNKAARAPSIVELFQNGDQGFATYTDACNDTAARTAAILAICQSQAPAVNFTGFSQNNSQVQAFAFGNPNLKQETAETYTLGAVIAPRSLPLGLGTGSITVDYYNIKIDDVISAFGAQTFITDCYRNGNVLGGCGRITRNTGTGQIDAVSTAVFNSNQLATDGIDASLNWVFPLSNLFSGTNARLRFNEVFTWVNHFRNGGTDLVGLAEAGIGNEFPRYKSTLSTSFETDSFTALLRWNYSSHLEQDFLGKGDPANPFQSPLSYFDLSLRQRVGDNFELTLIGHNFLGAKPTIEPIGFFDQANVDTTTYSNIILGRTFTVQARVRF